jgi:hypothetical protein
VSSRRNALKKAAVGAGVAGAVWVAPKIDGLSIVPDYASAGTGHITVTFTLVGEGPGILGGGNDLTAQPSAAYNIVTNGPSDDNAIQLRAPLGAIGDATWTFPKGLDTDGPAIPGGVVAFNVDPPFNTCHVTASVTDWQGSTGHRGTRNNGITANAGPNATGAFNVPISIADGPGAPGNNFFNPATKINSVTVTITC